MNQNKKAQHEMASSWLPDYQKGMLCKSWEEEASFWASKNYNGRVDFESHSTEWRVLPKCGFQHCNDKTKMWKKNVKLYSESLSDFGGPFGWFSESIHEHCRKWHSYNATISRRLQIFVLWGLAGIRFTFWCRMKKKSVSNHFVG